MALLSVAPIPARASDDGETPLPDPAPAPSQSNSGMGVAAGAAFGVGLVGLVVAGVSGALMLDKRAELEEDCGGGIQTCPASSQDELESYHRYGTISAVSLGVGAAGALTGLALLIIVSGEDEEQPRPTASLRAVGSPGFVGLTGSF